MEPFVQYSCAFIWGAMKGILNRNYEMADDTLRTLTFDYIIKEKYFQIHVYYNIKQMIDWRGVHLWGIYIQNHFRGMTVERVNGTLEFVSSNIIQNNRCTYEFGHCIAKNLFMDYFFTIFENNNLEEIKY